MPGPFSPPGTAQDINVSFDPGDTVNSRIRNGNNTAYIAPAQEDGNLASIKTNTDKIPSLGQTTKTGSVPVTIASDQDNLPTNLKQVNGTTISVNTGPTGNGSPRVTVAVDSATVAGSATLPAGSNIIGKVGIDQTTSGTTNLVASISGQNGVDGNSGVVTAKTQRMVLASDVSLPTGVNNIGKVTTVASASDLVDAGLITVDTQAVAAVANLRFVAYHVKESTGSSPSHIKLHHGVDATGPVLADISLLANESDHFSVGDRGIAIQNGLFVEFVSGSTQLSVIKRVEA